MVNFDPVGTLKVVSPSEVRPNAPTAAIVPRICWGYAQLHQSDGDPGRVAVRRKQLNGNASPLSHLLERVSSAWCLSPELGSPAPEHKLRTTVPAPAGAELDLAERHHTGDPGWHKSRRRATSADGRNPARAYRERP